MCIYIIVSIAVIKLVSWKIIVIPVESITDRDLDGLLPASITKPISLSVASGFLRGCRMNGHKLWIINKKGIKIMLVYDGIWIWIWVKRFLQIITRVSVFLLYHALRQPHLIWTHARPSTFPDRNSQHWVCCLAICCDGAIHVDLYNWLCGKTDPKSTG